MVSARIEPATKEDAAFIAANARDADRAEMWASHYMTPDKAIKAGMERGPAWTGFVDDEPVVIWGVVRTSLFPNAGSPWMFGTKKLEKVAMTFLRRCRAPLGILMQDYDVLFNYVDARNTRAIKWLKYMGFKVDAEAAPYGVMGLPFHKFEMGG